MEPNENTKNSQANFGATKSETQDFVGQQELIYQLSVFEQQMNQIQQQMQMVEQGISELGELGNGLEELKGKSGEEIMAPVGQGIL